MKIMTAFRKVSIKERLPKHYEDCFFITEDGILTSGYLVLDSNSDLLLVNSNCIFLELEYWLEEIELPEIKDVGQEGAWCGCRDYDAGMNEILELFK